jgi:predicted dinucleotide-binding enzyme
MKVLVIGAGNMGSAFVKQLHAAGHQVRVTARQAAKAAELAAQYSGVSALAPVDAAKEVDVVIVATGYADAVPALLSVGDLAGKVVVDITNPLSADYMALTLGHSTSAAEEIAKAVPEALVVKAFNTLFAQVLGAGADFGGGQKASVFYASDSAPAKLAHLSQPAGRTTGKLLICIVAVAEGLHYADTAWRRSGTSLAEIFGGGWAGNCSCNSSSSMR